MNNRKAVATVMTRNVHIMIVTGRKKCREAVVVSRAKITIATIRTRVMTAPNTAMTVIS